MSIFILSPSFMNKGTWTTAPVSTVADLVTFEAVSPFIPGSVSVTVNSAKFGASTWNGCPW